MFVTTATTTVYVTPGRRYLTKHGAYHGLALRRIGRERCAECGGYEDKDDWETGYVGPCAKCSWKDSDYVERFVERLARWMRRADDRERKKTEEKEPVR